jgi:DNA-binding NarL/FixJ family response regulator
VAATESPDRRRVVIVDDDAGARRALAALLDTYPQIEVVARAADGAQAVDLVSRLRPDVVLMDCLMPRLDGFAATRLIKSESPEVVVVLVSLYADLEGEARCSGADGFLVKTAVTESVIDLITDLGRRSMAVRSSGESPPGKGSNR